MKIFRCLLAVVSITMISASASAQVTKADQTKTGNVKILGSNLTASPAYAEILLRRTELESELESLILDYTEEFPKVKEIRQELGFLKRESDRLAAVKPAESSKLTLALGKLIVKKAELETDVWNLMKAYNEAHPDVKRAKRKVEIYEAAIKEILG